MAWCQQSMHRPMCRTCGAVWNRLDVCAKAPACSVSAASHRASLWPAARKAQNVVNLLKQGERLQFHVPAHCLLRERISHFALAAGMTLNLSFASSLQEAEQPLMHLHVMQVAACECEHAINSQDTCNAYCVYATVS